MISDANHLSQPVMSIAHRDTVTVHQDVTIDEALQTIRQKGPSDRILYIYAVGEEDKLVGVLPLRQLLTAPLASRVSEVMIRSVVAIPEKATVMEACEAFVLHKFMAFPVVNERRQIQGVVDISIFAEEAFDLAEKEQMDAMFESIGFQLSQMKGASISKAFMIRFPWLLATIASGTVCAVLAGAYELTLAKSIVLAFFLTMVLGLGESVSVQSMTVTIQALRTQQPTLLWYWRAFLRESGTALMLGTVCGVVVASIVWLWRGEGLAAIAIGLSVLLALCAACFFGLTVPAVLHALKLDPKIAAGPVTLACTDIFTLLFYFSIASALL